MKEKEESKAEFARVWGKLPPYETGKVTYVRWNEMIPRRPGKDNVHEDWELQATPELTLDNYKFL